MIYILHHNRYWTEYLSFLLDDIKNFKLVASKEAKEDYDSLNSLKNLQIFNAEEHDCILSPGRIFDKLGKNNNVILRFMHSPGFYVYPLIRAYADLTTQNKPKDFRIIILEEYYRCLVTQEFENEIMDYFKFQLMNDSRLLRSKVNPSLFNILNAPIKNKREEGTALIAFSWLLIDNDFSFFLKICKYLSSHIKLSIVLHPLMRLDESIIKEVNKYRGSLFNEIHYNITREALIDLYDKHEFIVSDGSGTCYEGMIRGCSPLAVREMQSLPKEAGFNLTLPDEYFPFPNYDEIHKAKFNSEPFLRQYFPYLYEYTQKQAETIAKDEIIKIKNNFVF